MGGEMHSRVSVGCFLRLVGPIATAWQARRVRPAQAHPRHGMPTALTLSSCVQASACFPGQSTTRSSPPQRAAPNRDQVRCESGSHETLCWSKGDSNSPSHPERQRSEGRPLGPAHRSRFRSRAFLRSAIVLRGRGNATGRADVFVLSGSNAHMPIARDGRASTAVKLRRRRPRFACDRIFFKISERNAPGPEPEAIPPTPVMIHQMSVRRARCFRLCRDDD
jgi:hypothetical protein